MKTKPLTVKYPKEIYHKLSESVIGQDDAKRTLSSAFAIAETIRANNLPYTAPRVLLYGPTGSGKTFLLQNLANVLDYTGIVFINCSELSGSTWQGASVSSIPPKISAAIQKQLDEIPGVTADLVKQVALTLLYRLIVVMDEFDKVAHKRNRTEDSDSTSKRTAQEDFLKLIEGSEYELKLVYGDKQIVIPYSTKVVNMVFLGAFEGLDELIKPTVKHNMGFFKPDPSTEQAKRTKDALHEYGFIRELLGRIEQIAKVNPLTKSEMKQIAMDQLSHKYESIFGMYGITACLQDKFWDDVAELAMQSKEGARALAEITHNQLKDYLFDVDKFANHYITITEAGETKAVVHDFDSKKKAVSHV